MTFEQEIVSVNQMPYGEARTAAAESLVRRIEAENATGVLAWALAELVEAYTFGGHSDRAFVAFARMLRLWDEQPEVFDEYDTRNLFWEYKWIADGVCDFPQISREQADEFFVDMERRFRLQGLGLSAVQVSRFNWARAAGDADAEDRRAAWRATPSDDFDDCPACVIGSQVGFFLEQGRLDEALELGLTQRDSCNIEPAKTKHAMALAALLTGDPDSAVRYHREALASFDGKTRDLAPSRGQSFEMMGRGGQLGRALRTLRNDDLGLLEQAESPLEHLSFLLGVLAGLSANIGGEADASEQLTGLPAAGGIDRATVAGLHTWVRDAAEQLAARFDLRNGNGHYAARVAKALSAEPTGLVLDFGVADRGDAELVAGLVDPERSLADEQSGDTREPDAAALFTRGEQLAAAGEFAAASVHYADAARGFNAEGLLGHAGLAHAEAAQCAATAGDEERAHSGFETAVSLMLAANVDPTPVLQVMTAWAPLAARMNDTREILQMIVDWIARLEAWEPDAHLSASFAGDAMSEVAFVRASARDLLARCLASSSPEHLPESVEGLSPAEEAEIAGGAFLEMGRLREAAHSFWLVGRLRRDAGDTVAAIEAYEQATAAGRFGVDRDAFVEAAGELIVLFRDAGLPEQAEKVVARLQK